jgi:Na+-transporting NADH:ubiquinone oxidoreductase subunit F
MANFTITLNNRKKIEAPEDKTILSALRENRIFLPSACGGKGACGQCRVKVKSGIEGPHNVKENFHLSAGEKELNFRLACQNILRNDIDIEIPEHLLLSQRYRTRVINLQDLTYDIKQVTLELLEPEKISFKAGQFIQFEVPAYEKTPERIFRPYSFASSPSNTGIIELHIRYVPDGISTTYIHRHLKEGDEVFINGPFGELHLRESNRDMVFIAGGSGMAPLRSMLHEMEIMGIKRKTRYFFGAVTQRDLFLVDEMKQFEEKLHDFRFIPALSAPLSEDDWKGETGLITEVVDRYIKSGENIEVYLCGSPGMVGACLKVMKAKGVHEDLIFYDRFF